MNVFAFLSFVVFLLYFQAAFFVLFALPRSRVKTLFIFFCLAFAVFSLGYFLIQESESRANIYLIDKVASFGWASFPAFAVGIFYLMGNIRSRGILNLIYFVLIPASVLSIIRYNLDPETIKIFYRENNVWFFYVNSSSIWFYLFAAYVQLSGILSLYILYKWRRTAYQNRVKLQADILLVSVALLVLFSTITNLVLPYFGESSIPSLAHINSLPLGVGLFFCLVRLQPMTFSREVMSNLIINRIREYIFFLDQNGEIYAANRYSLENLRYNSYELLRLNPENLFSDFGRIKQYIRQTGQVSQTPEIRMDLTTKNGDVIPVLMSLVRIDDAFKNFLGLVLIGVDYRQKLKLKSEVVDRMRNEKTLSLIRRELETMVEKRTEELSQANERLLTEITERKRAEKQIKADLEEKAELVKEIHHRVKNNIQMIISLINMLTTHKDITDEAIQKLRQIAERVRNISAIHEDFYSSPNFTRINFSSFLKKTTGEIYRNFRGPQNVIFRLNVADEYLDIDQAIPCGIIFSELITNSLKYAFPPERDRSSSLPTFSTINVEFYRKQNEYTLIVSDNGVGLPDGVVWNKAQSTGLQLIDILVKQHLKGKIMTKNSFGTLVILKFSR